MSTKRDLLIEIGTEELPPKALLKLSTAFTAGIVDGLQKADLEFSAVEPFAAPRRLAVLVKQLDTTQADKTVERRGPALSVKGLDVGKTAEGVRSIYQPLLMLLAENGGLSF